MTTAKRILIIGASGNQGLGVVRHCTAAGHEPYALVRDINSASASRLKKESSVPLLQGDLDDVDSLNKAMEGKDAVFFVVLPQGLDVEHRRTSNVIAAARASGTVSTVIYSGALWTGMHEQFPNFGPEHAMYQYWLGKQRNEAMVREAGFKHWVIARPAMFLQDFIPPISNFMFPQLASEGLFRVGYGRDTKFEVVDASDVGKLVAGALSEPEEYSGNVYELMLPAVTAEELAESMSKAKGEKVVTEHVDIDQLSAEMGERPVASQRIFKAMGPFGESKEAVVKFPLTGMDEYFAKHYMAAK